ncbi:MAG: type IV secretion system DNA-binding domain-containing protein [Verrucomicrobiia bacterium]
MSSFDAFLNLLTVHDGAPKDPSALWRLFSTPQGEGNGSGAAVSVPQFSPCAVHFDKDHFFWALHNLLLKAATEHMACIGTIGSGKTTLIRLFLQSIAPRVRADWPGPPEQLVVFDSKFDAIPILAGMGLHPDSPNVYIFNPHDERSVSWNMADLAQTPLLARHLAALLVPEEKQATAPFFASSARDLIYAIILGLNVAKGNRWTFRDLICAIDTPERIRKVTARHPRAEVIAARILNDKRHAFGVHASLATKLVQFEPVAALWHSSESKRSFSISEFIKKPGVLILGGDPILKDTLEPINALVLKALEQEILRLPDADTPRHWFCLDEFASMGKVEGIRDLLRLGRSKGVSVLLGVHGTEGLIEKYDENVAEEILGLCTYKTFLRASSPKSAKWAEDYFGQERRMEEIYGESWTKGEKTESFTYELKDRSVLLASTFSDMPLPEPGTLFHAISDVPCLRSTLISTRWFDDMLTRWRKGKGKAPPLIPRDQVEAQTLAPWEPEEERDFYGEEEPGKKKIAAKSETESEAGLDKKSKDPTKELPDKREPKQIGPGELKKDPTADLLPDNRKKRKRPGGGKGP